MTAFSGYQCIVSMLMFLAALPPPYYGFIGLRRENRPLFLTGIAFGFSHVVHVHANLWG